MLSENFPEDPDCHLPRNITCPNNPQTNSSVVCIDPICTETRLACDECYNQFHPFHQCITAAELSEISSRLHLGEQKQLSYKSMFGMLKEYHGTYMEWIRSTRKSIDGMMDSLETRVGGWFGNMELILQRTIEESVEAGDSLDEDQRKLIQDILRTVPTNMEESLLKGYKIVLENQLKSEQEKFKKLEESIKEKLFESLETIRVTTKKVEAAFTDSRIGQLYCENMFKKKNSIQQWKCSAKLRHRDITTTENLIYRDAQTSKDVSVAALLDIKLGDSQPCQWGFRIVSKSLYIGLGICLESKAIEGRFAEDDWEEIGHGHYLNGSAGGTYSHSEPGANHRVTSFGFNEGDEVQLQQDPSNNLLTLVKNGKEERQLSIEPAPAEDNYRPCVYLSRPGDCVELLKLH